MDIYFLTRNEATKIPDRERDTVEEVDDTEPRETVIIAIDNALQAGTPAPCVDSIVEARRN